MNSIRFIAAACSACITFAILSAMLSIAEPQRSTLLAQRHDPSGAPKVQVAVQSSEDAAPVQAMPPLGDD